MNELVSIIVPVYNGEKYLNKCINSLVKQTYDSIEIILVDDGSKDSSFAICKKWEAQDARIKTFRTENLGVSNARNLGMQSSNGKWICFVDADDWLEENAILTMASYGQKELFDVGIFDFFHDSQNSTVYDSHFDFNAPHLFAKAEKIELLSDCVNKARFAKDRRSANAGVPWAKLYLRETLMREKASFPSGIKRMQDMIFNLYVIYGANRIMYYPVAVYHYRGNESSVTFKYTPDFDVTMDKILKELVAFIKESGEESLVRHYKIKKVKLFLEWVKLSVIPYENRMSFKGKHKEIYDKARSMNIKDAAKSVRRENVLLTQYIGCFFAKHGFMYLLILYYSLGRTLRQKRIFR